MMKRVVTVFVVASIYVGIAYIFWISKAGIVDEIVSIPLISVALFGRDLNAFEKFSAAFLGVAVFQGAKVDLLTVETLWKGLLVGVGGAAIPRTGSPRKIFSFIIPPVMPALFQLMSDDWKIALINYVLTSATLLIIRRREV